MRGSGVSRYLASVLPVLLHIHCGGARVLTEVPSGPLYRVAGAALQIPCEVSGFTDTERVKNFQFLMQRPGEGRDINIISTEDAQFAYGVFNRRVRNKEITLEHDGPNKVLFTISSLLASDEGEYECCAVNHEGAYLGVYSAKILVNVIDNSLTVSSLAPTSMSLDQGNPLALTCHASSNTVQHTHLSVTWYLHTDKEQQAHPVVSLDRDLTLAPGPRFQERYRAGAVGLDKVGEAAFRLNIAQLEPSDQGRLYCRAREWIQDPDRFWYAIAQNDSEATALRVKAKDREDAHLGSVAVAISVQQDTLQEGQELAITCSVDGPAAGQLFSVAWLLSGSELARFGPTGVLRVGAQYHSRHAGGELMATKTGDGVHQVLLRPVRVQDQGGYLCRAWPQERGPDGSFTQGQAQDSQTQMVRISATASGLSVHTDTESVAVMEGDTLHLTCTAKGFKGQLSVTWEHKSEPTAASPFRKVVGLSPAGVMESGQDFTQRRVSATRPAAHVFTLGLHDVLPSDAGTYQCTVSEWTVKPNGVLDKTHSQAQIYTVNVTLLETALRLELKGRGTQATVGGQVELVCVVRGPSVPMTLRWTLRREGSASVEELLELSPDGAITWRGHRPRYQLEVRRNGETEVRHMLLIAAASAREAGRYQCESSVFLQNRHKRMAPSNMLAVAVTRPESKLSLSSASRLSSSTDADVTLRCSVVETTSQTARYAVTWKRENRTLLVSGRDAAVTPGDQAPPGDGQRISMQRRAGPSFELTIWRARPSDSGRYLCAVVEWLQDPDLQWFGLPQAQTTTTLQVTEPESRLSLAGRDVNLTLGPSQDLILPCNITSWSSPAPAFKVTWFWRTAPGVEKRAVFTAHSDGTLQEGSVTGVRLRFRRPLQGLFSLTVSGATREDGGLYHCEVEEWVLSPPRRRVGTVARSGDISVDVAADRGDAISGHHISASAIGHYVLAGLVLVLLLVIGLLVLKIRSQSPGPEGKQSLWTEGHPLKNPPITDRAEGDSLRGGSAD